MTEIYICESCDSKIILKPFEECTKCFSMALHSPVHPVEPKDKPDDRDDREVKD